MQDVNVSNDLR
jgi:hypothetical protein